MLAPHARRIWRSQPARVTAIRIALAALALCVLTTFARSFIGDASTSAGPLEITSVTANFQPTAQLQAVPAGWTATFGAVWVFWEYLTAHLGVGGMAWLVLPLFCLALIWWTLALLGEWRRPPIILIALLLVQGWAAGHLLLPYLSPTHRLETQATAFDFGADYDGSLSSRQVVKNHRARGYSGLVFAGLHRVVPADELQVLRAANPDMTLLNGCEYRGSAHLIFVGVQQAIEPETHDVAAAIQAAKDQGGLVFAVPNFEGEYSTPEYSAQRLLQMGANGLIVVPDEERVLRAMELVKSSGRAVVTATLSTPAPSPSTSWTLLPSGATSREDIARFVRAGQVAVAYPPQSTQVSQNFASSDQSLAAAMRAAWNRLSRAQRVNVVLGLAALSAMLVFWGAGSPAAAVARGPQRAVGFLRRRRQGGRIFGLALMLLAWIGTLSAIWSIANNALWLPAFPSLYLLPIFAALTLLYLYGRSLWKQVQ